MRIEMFCKYGFLLIFTICFDASYHFLEYYCTYNNHLLSSYCNNLMVSVKGFCSTSYGWRLRSCLTRTGVCIESHLLDDLHRSYVCLGSLFNSGTLCCPSTESKIEFKHTALLSDILQSIKFYSASAGQLWYTSTK